MATAIELIKTLKQELNSRSMTHQQVADSLGVSKGKIQRWLNPKNNISLSNLENICQVINLDLAQLVTKALENRKHIYSLSAKHEQELVNDKQLLMLAIYLMCGWRYEDACKFFRINTLEGRKLLARLEEMRIIERLNHDHIRVLHSPQFQWRKNGAIERFFESEIQPQFFSSRFHKEGEKRFVCTGFISMNNINAFHEKMHRLVSEFEEMRIKHDQNTPIEKRCGTSLVVAIRPWELSEFNKYRN